MSKRRAGMRNLRKLRHESLESRSLLAGLAGCSPWQNPDGSNDVNADGSVSPIDALVTINSLNEAGAGQLSGRFAPPALHGRFAGAVEHFVDPSGDSQLTPIDALLIINALNTKQAATLGQDSPDTADPAHDDESDDRYDEPSDSPDVPAVDTQPDVIGADVPELVLSNGFARVRSAINVAGDADVFRVVAADAQLSVTLFVPGNSTLNVSLVDVDGNTISTVSSDGLSGHEHVTLDSAVEAGATYFLVVAASPDATGRYCLAVMNYDPTQFTPLPGEHHDGGSDEGSEGQHGDLPEHPQPPTPASLFAKLDTNSDGSLTIDELQVLPARPNESIDWTTIFADLDADGDGSVTSAEFVAGLPSVLPPGGPHHDRHDGPDGGPHGGPHGGPGDGHGAPLTPPTPEAAFAQVDANSDGLATLDELETVVRSPRMLRMLDQIFAEWDVDGSGSLDIDEFSGGATA